MKKKITIRWLLVFYDTLVYAAIVTFFLLYYQIRGGISIDGMHMQLIVSYLFIFGARILCNVYGEIWRYGGVKCYLKLIFADALSFVLYVAVNKSNTIETIPFVRVVAISSVNLIGALFVRMVYRYTYKFATEDTVLGKLLIKAARLCVSGDFYIKNPKKTTNIAIVGAGRVGSSLAAELIENRESQYSPKCFVDTDSSKTGREIYGIPVISENSDLAKTLKTMDIEEIVVAIPDMENEQKKLLYEKYKEMGYRIKAYDYPTAYIPGQKRQLRDFDIDELLFRKPVYVMDNDTCTYYKNKTILITGGGGSIGSELCRQIAKMNPKQIIILDIYENGAYEIQQELKIMYKDTLDTVIEIVSITNRKAMERIFNKYRPDIVINAAAHKHVPLMEHNSIEAIENNIFGTVILVQLCEKYKIKHFMMVSTDKAVNPTNVMGATKRMCEMIVQSAGQNGIVKCTITRFGNVLGSAGSVIPLFKKQIASGGPVTITDKRITRYFMTIPEAAQLVLHSGAMANNGELFVLDMGQPVKIIDLAQNMIKLAGAYDIDIVEVGLRPGEKLYEELLIDITRLNKTENEKIFIENDKPLSKNEIIEKIKILKDACLSGDEDKAKDALQKAVPSYTRKNQTQKIFSTSTKEGPKQQPTDNVWEEEYKKQFGTKPSYF